MLLRIFIFSILFTLISGTADAQAAGEEESCYHQLRNAGIQLMNEGNFGKAINQFWAALECSDLKAGHDLNLLIRKVQDKWVSTLELEVNRAKEAEEKADQARTIAVQAKEAEEEARKE